jgi:hypothetical protein
MVTMPIVIPAIARPLLFVSSLFLIFFKAITPKTIESIDVNKFRAGSQNNKANIKDVFEYGCIFDIASVTKNNYINFAKLNQN